MTTNINFSKRSLAISAILASSVLTGAAFGADERRPHDVADQARSMSTAARDLAASAAGRSPAVPSAPSVATVVPRNPDNSPMLVKRSAPAPESKLSTRGGQISRAEVLRRAKYWFDNRGGIHYDMNARAVYRDPDAASHEYRRDCSGFVSMALHLTMSLNTVALPGVGEQISRTAMQPGDFTGILGRGTDGSAGHVRLFERWANKSAGTYWAYDFGSASVKHQIYKLSTDASRNGIGWTAYRYKKIM